MRLSIAGVPVRRGGDRPKWPQMNKATAARDPGGSHASSDYRDGRRRAGKGPAGARRRSAAWAGDPPLTAGPAHATTDSHPSRLARPKGSASAGAAAWPEASL